MLLSFGVSLERHSALFAEERPIRGMGFAVDAERRAILERFLANVTAIMPFIAVRFEVTN